MRHAVGWLHICVAECVVVYHGVCAGFFLVLAQPFRLGDKVAVSCSAPGVGAHSAAAAAVRTASGTTAAAAATSSGYSSQLGAVAGERGAGAGAGSGSSGSTPPGWFEGICEKVDLRYTVLR